MEKRAKQSTGANLNLLVPISLSIYPTYISIEASVEEIVEIKGNAVRTPGLSMVGVVWHVLYITSVFGVNVRCRRCYCEAQTKSQSEKIAKIWWNRFQLASTAAYLSAICIFLQKGTFYRIDDRWYRKLSGNNCWNFTIGKVKVKKLLWCHPYIPGVYV